MSRRRTRFRGLQALAFAFGLLAWLPVARAVDDVVEATLDNGLRVLLLEDHRSPVVTLQVWYRVGSRHERVGLSGISHFLEHMMFKGTPTFGPRAYAQLVEAQGGRKNAFTSRDATVYFVTVAADRLDPILELEADRMRHLTLDPREIEAERRVVLEERRTRTEDDPVGTLAEELNAVAFKVHPYRIPPIGFPGDVERITGDDLRAWYNTYYVPNNALVVAVGAFHAPELLEKVRARFGTIPRGPAPPVVSVIEPPQRGERRAWVRKEARLPVVLIGYHAPNVRSADAYTLEALDAILSSGRASRLPRRLVHEARLALAAGADYTRLHLDPEQFTLWATAMPGRAIEEVEQALAAEVARLRTDLVDEEELDRAKNQIEAAFLFRQDSVWVRASTLGRHELVGGFRLTDEYVPRVRAVTREAVREAARRYLVTDRQTTAILVPVTPADAPAR